MCTANWMTKEGMPGVLSQASQFESQKTHLSKGGDDNYSNSHGLQLGKSLQSPVDVHGSINKYLQIQKVSKSLK